MVTRARQERRATPPCALSLCKISQKIPRNFLADTLEKVAQFLKDSLHTDIITQKIPTEFSGGYSGESS